jgi:NADPH:quinone reductase
MSAWHPASMSSTASMRAVLVEEHGGPDVLAVRDVEAPEPGPGQVAIDVAYAGVNYAEVMGRRGTLPLYQPPFVPGLEVSGTVRAFGAGVEGLRVGQRVAALTTRGGYAEVALAPAAVTFPLDDDADLVAAAAFAVIVPTAWALVHEVARLRAGESVLVHAAAGGVGTVAAQVARAAGVGPILGVASTPTKAGYARGFGYDEVFVGDAWVEAARAATGGRGLDAILDSIGGETRARGFDLLAPLGRLVLFGNATDEPEPGIADNVLRAQVKGVLGFSIAVLAATDPERARAIGEVALAAVARGEVRVDVTEVIPLDDAPKAHQLLEGRGSTGKLVLAVAPA